MMKKFKIDKMKFKYFKMEAIGSDVALSYFTCRDEKMFSMYFTFNEKGTLTNCEIESCGKDYDDIVEETDKHCETLSLMVVKVYKEKLKLLSDYKKVVIFNKSNLLESDEFDIDNVVNRRV